MSAVLEAFQRAAGDHERGASEIERMLVAELLSLRDGWSFDLVREGAGRLARAHPAMANMRSLALRAAEGEEVFADYLAVRNQLLDRLDDLFAEHCWPLIEDCRRLLTISRSSGVRSVLQGAWQRGWRGEVVVFDGSSAGCGPEQARRLAEHGLDVRSQPDATVVSWLDTTDAGTAVVAGADALSERRVVNACGSGSLFELATARGVPCIVVADSAKDLPDRILDELVVSVPPFEEAEKTRSWPVFEVFSAHFVTWRVDERGCRNPACAGARTIW